MASAPHTGREALLALLPGDLPRPRVARGEALFFARGLSPDIAEAAGFTAHAIPDGCALTPSRAQIPLLDRLYPAYPNDALCRDFRRLAARAVSDDEMMLLIRALKWFGKSPVERALFDEKLRQAAAVCLRLKEGGGALALLRRMMLTHQGG